MESSVNKSDYSEGNLIKESAKEELMCILESVSRMLSCIRINGNFI